MPRGLTFLLYDGASAGEAGGAWAMARDGSLHPVMHFAITLNLVLTPAWAVALSARRE